MRFLVYFARLSLLFGAWGVAVIGGAWTWFLSTINRKGHSRGLGAVVLPAPLQTLDLLIPAHNEAESLKRLLPALRTELDHLRERYPALNVKIHIGADACSDETEAVARSFGAEVSVYPENRSKWKTLTSLTAATQAEWVGWMDAEANWPKQLLAEVVTAANEDGNRMGIAPAFGENALWRFEEKLKLLENQLGGPISVHGATVFYRREELTEALRTLQGKNWWNDDVVVPLLLRAQNPSNRIHYFVPAHGRVTEAARDSQTEGRFRSILGQRSRMAAGNLQWIYHLWVVVVRMNPSVGLLALRRVLRPFWVYFLLALEFSFLIFSRRNLGVAVVPLFGPALLALVYPEQVLPPVLASLWLPFRFRAVRRGRVSWR